MTVSKVPPSRLQVTKLEAFLRCPPSDFSVEKVGSALIVSSDPDSSLVLIDGLEACGEKVIFPMSLGR